MYAFIEKLVDPLSAAPVVRPPENVGDFFRFFLRPIKGLLIITLVISGIAAFAELLLYAFLGKLVDWMSSTPPSQFFDEHGTTLIVMAVVAGIIRPVATIASRAIINLALMPGLTNTVRWRSHRYILRQSLSYFQNDFAGRIAQKVMQTGHALREATLNVIDGVWLLAIYLIGAAILFSDLDWRLLIPVIVWLVGYLAVIVTMVPPVKAKSAKMSEVNSELTGRVVDSYTNIQSVKLFAKVDREDDFAASSIQRHTSALRHLMRAILDMVTALTVLNTLLLLSHATVSIYLWTHGSISIGAIAMSNGLVIRLSQMSGWILRTIAALFESIGTVENGVQTISQTCSVEDRDTAGALAVSEGDIKFDQIGFKYGDDDQVIRDLSLHVRPGEKVGIVGRSGAGKSTLVNLFLRFYDLQEGKILIDGQDIREVSQESLRAQIAMVTQDTSLLHRSIRDNIRYGQEEATQEQVEAAAKLAAAHDFIPDLVDPQGRRGFDAYVGERGVKLSGGQRQRVALARVILKNAPILVLDEATSALDSEVEAAIQEQLQTLMQGKTVIAIAHRLSTIAALDRLIVMDQGRIVETGDHETLLRQQGLYAKLWQHQSGGFLGASLDDGADSDPGNELDENRDKGPDNDSDLRHAG